MSLARFFGSETHVNHERMQKLLALLQKHTRPVRPELLGVIGEEHLRAYDRRSTAASRKASNTRSAPGSTPRRALRRRDRDLRLQDVGRGQAAHDAAGLLITGVNFSATLANPFSSMRGEMEGMDDMLAELRAGPGAPVIVASTTPVRTSNISIAAKAASAWSSNDGCR